MPPAVPADPWDEGLLKREPLEEEHNEAWLALTRVTVGGATDVLLEVGGATHVLLAVGGTSEYEAPELRLEVESMLVLESRC